MSKSSSRLELSILWAGQIHQGQYREGKDPLPYITHPIDVMNRIRAAGITDEDLLIAAALHDVIEEGEVDYANVQRDFGDRVAGLVLELTRREPTPLDTEGLAKDEIYNLRTLIMLKEIEKMSVEAQTIKLGDRLSNLEYARFTRSKKRLARYVSQSSEILRIIPRSVNPSLWDELQGLIKSLNLV